jgi:uncharacterized membrane protein HdeD (DUF308 family)
MTTQTTTPLGQQLKTETKRWSWLWLVAGVLWIVISVIILQFDEASAATVGAIAGVMLIYAGIEYFVLGSMTARLSWVWYLFGGFLFLGGMVALFYPTRTFFAMANILGFMMVFIGVMWIVEAFLARDYYDLWWLHLVAGILTMGLGFWMSGQFLVTQAAALLVFAGLWAMMRGILDITAFFATRSVADAIPTEPTQ